MEQPKQVAIIDEDVIAIRPFVYELELRGIEVIQFTDADSCAEELGSLGNIDLFILDVMLATKQNSKLFNAIQTNNYLHTGLLLAAIIREQRPYAPIIFFSNASSSDLVRKIAMVADRLGYSAYWKKFYVNSAESLGDDVENVLTKGISSQHTKLKKLWSSIVAQPNLGGVGIDIKKLLD